VGWTAKVAKHIKADLAELGNDADELLMHLLTQPFEPVKRSEVFLISSWLRVAAQCYGTPNVLGRAERARQPDDQELTEEAKAANARLASIGLRVIGKREEAVMFIANAPIAGLKQLFAHTQWAGGAWKQSADRVPGAVASENGRKIAGILSRGIEIPFRSMPGLLGLPTDQEKPQPTAPEPATYVPEDFA
jgi:hypothetical protein